LTLFSLLFAQVPPNSFKKIRKDVGKFSDFENFVFIREINIFGLHCSICVHVCAQSCLFSPYFALCFHSCAPNSWKKSGSA
jgi:hypothetical protein